MVAFKGVMSTICVGKVLKYSLQARGHASQYARLDLSDIPQPTRDSNAYRHLGRILRYTRRD